MQRTCGSDSKGYSEKQLRMKLKSHIGVLLGAEEGGKITSLRNLDVTTEGAHRKDLQNLHFKSVTEVS